MTAQHDMFGADPSIGSLVGIKVKLDRPVDRERPCCGNVCIISPSKAQHTAELRCAGCGSHRGWASKQTLNFISETIGRFGAPSDPIIVRQPEKAMAFELKPNRGSLFRNDEKTRDEDRDYSGSINIEGREYWLSGWVKEGKKGKFLSLSIKPKSADNAKPKTSNAEELHDHLPF